MRLFVLLLAIAAWEACTDDNLRIWRDRLRVAALVAFGLWLAGAGDWRAVAAGIAAGALCIAPPGRHHAAAFALAG